MNQCIYADLDENDEDVLQIGMNACLALIRGNGDDIDLLGMFYIDSCIYLPQKCYT